MLASLTQLFTFDELQAVSPQINPFFSQKVAVGESRAKRGGGGGRGSRELDSGFHGLDRSMGLQAPGQGENPWTGDTFWIF